MSTCTVNSVLRYFSPEMRQEYKDFYKGFKASNPRLSERDAIRTYALNTKDTLWNDWGLEGKECAASYILGSVMHIWYRLYNDGDYISLAYRAAMKKEVLYYECLAPAVFLLYSRWTVGTEIGNLVWKIVKQYKQMTEFDDYEIMLLRLYAATIVELRIRPGLANEPMQEEDKHLLNYLYHVNSSEAAKEFLQRLKANAPYK